MIGKLFSLLLYLIPLLAITFFITSICNYSTAKKSHKAEPNDLNAHKMNTSKKLLIVSTIVMVVFLAIIIGFIAMMYTAIAYM